MANMLNVRQMALYYELDSTAVRDVLRANSWRIDHKPNPDSNKTNCRYLYDTEQFWQVWQQVAEKSQWTKLADAGRKYGVGIGEMKRVIQKCGMQTKHIRDNVFIRKDELLAEYESGRIFDILTEQVDEHDVLINPAVMRYWDGIERTQTIAELTELLHKLQSAHKSSRSLMIKLLNNYPAKIYDALVVNGIIEPDPLALEPYRIDYIDIQHTGILAGALDYSEAEEQQFANL